MFSVAELARFLKHLLPWTKRNNHKPCPNHLDFCQDFEFHQPQLGNPNARGEPPQGFCCLWWWDAKTRQRPRRPLRRSQIASCAHGGPIGFSFRSLTNRKGFGIEDLWFAVLNRKTLFLFSSSSSEDVYKLEKVKNIIFTKHKPTPTQEQERPTHLSWHRLVPRLSTHCSTSYPRRCWSIAIEGKEELGGGVHAFHFPWNDMFFFVRWLWHLTVGWFGPWPCWNHLCRILKMFAVWEETSHSDWRCNTLKIW